MAAHALSMQLEREREMLELLLFRLDVQQLLIAAGRTRGIRHAVDELRRVVAAMPMAALSRDAHVSVVADEWGVPEATTLTELIAVAPTDAWRQIFSEYLSTMIALVVEIKQMEQVNVQRCDAALRSTRDMISGGDGEWESLDDLEALARLQSDEGSFQIALQASTATLQTNLTEFLR